MNEDSLIDYLAKYNGFEKDYKNLFPNKEETIRLLMNVTLPNDLDKDFFKLEQSFIKGMNSRIELISPKKLDFNDGIVFIKHDPLSIDGDILLNMSLYDFFAPQDVMRKNINDDIVFHGGLEIRKDLLGEIAKQNHSIEAWEKHITDGYALPYKKIIHISFKNKLETEDDIKSFSTTILDCFKEFKTLRGKTIVIPLFDRESNEIEHLLRICKSYLRTTYSSLKLIFVTNSDELYSKYLPLFD